MSILTPMGLLALLALIILFLIYFVKPTYQNKVLSSTYIWRESLKYKKNPRPTSKLKNIFLVFLQVMIILISTAILITPIFYTNKVSMNDSSIIIIDGSAAMLNSVDGESRFDRAIEKAKSFAKNEIKDNRSVSIIYAGAKPELVIKESLSSKDITQSLDGLSCGYGNVDMKGAIAISNELIETSFKSAVYLYTGTSYSDNGDINIIDVSLKEEWNSEILTAEALLDENYYTFNTTIKTYGDSKYLNVSLKVSGVNDELTTIEKTIKASSAENKEIKVSFKDLGIYAYDSATIEIKSDDNMLDSNPLDNKIMLTGGRKPSINIQYFSKSPNNFFTGALLVLKDRYKDYFNINLHMVEKMDECKNTGMDIYIYEHMMPSMAPTDGAIFLVNPDILPANINLTIGDLVSGDFTLKESTNSPIMSYITAANITATSYKKINKEDGYTSLLKINDDDVFVVNDEEDILVLTLNLNRSNLPVLLDFPILINNIFEYLIPTTIKSNLYNVDDEIAINSRGTNVILRDEVRDKELTTPTSITLARPGLYKISETLKNNKKQETEFFIRIPMGLGDINKVVDSSSLFIIKRPEGITNDIYIYLAGALLLTIILERFIRTREKL